MEDLKEALKNIKLPKNYDNLHDLNFLYELEKLGKLATGNLEKAKTDIINSQTKTFDVVLEYIPQDQLKDYTVCPGYDHIFETAYSDSKQLEGYKEITTGVYNISRTFRIYENFNSALEKLRDNTIYNFSKNNKNVIAIKYNHINSFILGEYVIRVVIFYTNNNKTVLEKLEGVNKWVNKFLVDTKNKHIHAYSVNNDFQKICSIQYTKNNSVINDNKLNIFSTFKEKYTDNSLHFKHVFDLATNTYQITTNTKYDNNTGIPFLNEQVYINKTGDKFIIDNFITREMEKNVSKENQLLNFYDFLELEDPERVKEIREDISKAIEELGSVPSGLLNR